MTDLILAAVIGGIIALLLDWLVKHRVTQAWKARRLAHAFYEELGATSFNQVLLDGTVPERPEPAAHVRELEILGFTSQTFDTLFGDFAQALPETLVRDLMRYHWNMKFLVGELAKGARGTGGALPDCGHVFILSEQDWFGLTERLDAYKKKPIWKLVLRRGETYKPQ